MMTEGQAGRVGLAAAAVALSLPPVEDEQ